MTPMKKEKNMNQVQESKGNKIILEPFNAISHLVGAILSAVGMCWMIYNAVSTGGGGAYLAGALFFGISLICLYSASAIYHSIPGSVRLRKFLRQLDHSMIYLLIAGTYTPICLVTLKGVLGYTLLGLVWGLAIVGIILKLAWMNAPRWLYTSFYVFLGWLAIFFIYPLYKNLPIEGFWWLITGGLLYTIGAVIYATKSKWLQMKHLGFHEIFHLFILGGSFAHVMLVGNYVLR